MIQFPIIHERHKGPQTPNFRKLPVMLDDKIPTKIPIDRKSVILKHGGVGIKMNYACDIIEELQRLSGEVKTWRNRKVVRTEPKKF